MINGSVPVQVAGNAGVSSFKHRKRAFVPWRRGKNGMLLAHDPIGCHALTIEYL